MSIESGLMSIEEFAEDFLKSLDDEREDEFYGTDRELGNNLIKRYREYCLRREGKICVHKEFCNDVRVTWTCDGFNIECKRYDYEK